jgi:hypothetical protein
LGKATWRNECGKGERKTTTGKRKKVTLKKRRTTVARSKVFSQSIKMSGIRGKDLSGISYICPYKDFSLVGFPINLCTLK